MKTILTAGQTRAADAATQSELGIPSLVLMERAAESAAEIVMSRTKTDARILIVCGVGNNGADGAACGRILAMRGRMVHLFVTGQEERGTDEFRLQLAAARKLGIPVTVSMGLPGELPEFDVLVDAVFGVGLSRDVSGRMRRLFEELSGMQEGTFTLALDIPSGIHPDTGAVLGCALKADVTAVFGNIKPGLILYPGRTFAGEIVECDIGICRFEGQNADLSLAAAEKTDLFRLLNRAPDGHKGTFGRVLVVAGSQGMCGAAYLAGLAAYRAGAGLVRFFTPKENAVILQTLLPEALLFSYDTEALDEDQIASMCGWADAIVLGPGLGKKAYVSELVEMILAHAYVPVVLDADGLNAAAEYPELCQYFTENIIITPHMGEMQRLLRTDIQQIKQDPVGHAAAYAAQMGVVCVLKDAVTVTADKDGHVWINTSGSNALAKGGTGDVLSGTIAALAAGGLENTQAAYLGAYLHGLAGEYAGAKRGNAGVLAHEVADAIPKVLDEADKKTDECSL